MRKIACLIIITLIVIWPAFITQSSIAPNEPFKFKGNGVIKIYNTHTHEFETIKYKEGEKYLRLGVEEINKILRCRLTGETTNISLKLIELADHLEDHFGAKDVEVISGYRSPKLNHVLRLKSRHVASHSLHMKGLAMDIKLPGVPLKKIRDYTKTLKVGGVGYYPGKFIHIDVGPVRYW